MTAAEVTKLQKDLNAFTDRWLTKFPKLVVDGDRGHATNRRIQTAKWYIGYTGKAQRSSKLTDVFRKRLRHPAGERVPEAMQERGQGRRRKQRAEANNPFGPGVREFDGRPCARWLVPYLEFARAHGWKGTLVSGYRTPEFSESLCQAMCGAPSCPGKCAGRSSNHSGSESPHGAVDVSDFVRFGELMKQCPHQPPIFNALGAIDPVHYSATGR